MHGKLFYQFHLNLNQLMSCLKILILLKMEMTHVAGTVALTVHSEFFKWATIKWTQNNSPLIKNVYWHDKYHLIQIILLSAFNKSAVVVWSWIVCNLSPHNLKLTPSHTEILSYNCIYLFAATSSRVQYSTDLNTMTKKAAQATEVSDMPKDTFKKTRRFFFYC